MSEKKKTDERLGPLLEYFGERLNRVFAHFLCTLEFKGDDDMQSDPGTNDRTWSLMTIQNACSHGSLIAIRDLDDFLTERDNRSKADDLKASDFGYKANRSFLSRTERESINKLIAHTTTVGATTQGFRWDIWELTSKCVAQSTEFLKWVEGYYGLSHFTLFTAALACRTKTQKIHEYIGNEISKKSGITGG